MKKQKLMAAVLSSVIAFQYLSSFVPSAKASFESYQKTFIVTAYYSPLPDQDFYVTGSLASDKRLNGNGTNGADGTPVYSGLIAAPSTYAFGIGINCPGYINGEIHDRGGAIVKAGKRNNAYDRLDFWAGYGDKGLRTALYWGKRTLTCTVSAPGQDHGQQFVSLPNAPTTFGIAQTPTRRPSSTYTTVAYAGIPTKYKQMLSDLGYAPEDKASRIAFQMRHNIIDSIDESVAGNVGPRTKAKLEQIFSHSIPPEGLEFGNVSTQVRQLQQILVDQEYLKTAPTAIFGAKTKQALIEFQLNHKLIDSPQDLAAGYLGPGTHAALKKVVLEEELISNEDRQLVSELKLESNTAQSLAKANQLAQQKPSAEQEENPDENYEKLRKLSQEWINEHSNAVNEQEHHEPEIQLASIQEDQTLKTVKEKLSPLFNPFDKHLSIGSKGGIVQQVQKLLQDKGYFEGKIITEYFGPQTQAAVVKFQLDYEIVNNAWSPGAGIVGPKTVQALNAIFYRQKYSLPFEVSNVIRAPAVHPNDLKSIEPLQHASKEIPTI